MWIWYHWGPKHGALLGLGDLTGTATVFITFRIDKEGNWRRFVEECLARSLSQSENVYLLVLEATLSLQTRHGLNSVVEPWHREMPLHG